jgi:glucuronate isomerase
MAFITEDFLLTNRKSRHLYHTYAEHEPILDYHCHLPPRDIADNRQFHNLTEIWLEGDHYKWRAMRTAGVREALITGPAAPLDRFRAFAGIVPQCLGNPIYHWTHMELRRPLGIEVLLDASTADAVWDRGRERLADDGFGARGLLAQFNVRMVGTTDDPADSLDAHAALASDASFDIAVLPTWRPDLLFKPEHDDFPGWIERLGSAAGIAIQSFPDLLEALTRRLDHFAARGCVCSDHGFDQLRFAIDVPPPESILAHRLAGRLPTDDDIIAWQSALAVWLGRQYAARNWVMQLHIGALRDTNSAMRAKIGPNTGFDSIDDRSYAAPLAAFLDTLESESALPRTILYGLNPRDNEMLATMAGNFQGHGIAGRMQFGSAWWFNDQSDGIRRQLTSVSQMSLLSRFVGMLTDSRSFLSFSRHEYFRRILCSLVGGWVEAGEAPADFDLLGNLVRDVCGRNAAAYFGLDGAEAAG